MYDHIGLRVKNLDVSVRFYEAALNPLGHVLCSQDSSGAGLGPEGAPALWLYAHKGTREPGVHIAFAAKDRAAVDKFHKDGIKAGGRDNGKPGLRPHYHEHYYAAFVLDLDGHNIEAVCHTPA